MCPVHHYSVRLLPLAYGIQTTREKQNKKQNNNNNKPCKQSIAKRVFMCVCTCGHGSVSVRVCMCVRGCNLISRCHQIKCNVLLVKCRSLRDVLFVLVLRLVVLQSVPGLV